MDLTEGNGRLILRKETALRGVSGNPEISSGMSGEPVPVPGGTIRLGLAASADGQAGTAPAGELITSPIVATFYAASGPDAPPFVEKGGRVKAGETLCILEAMKMMNHLEAEFDCEILSIKAASGDLVEYGQALFEVKRL
jgi:acetyl-CoA carboxylase biotin carboxyl carrier protein